MKKVLIGLVCVSAAIAAPKPPKKQPDIVAMIQQQKPLTRTLTYSEQDIPTIHTQLSFTTVVVLPKAEKVMDILIGKASEWEVNGAAGTNFAYLKPERANAKTNLNLVTASGNVYSFLLVEGDGPPDLKVFVGAKDAAMLSQMVAAPKWVLASELDIAKQQVTAAKQAADAAKDEARRTQEQAEAHAAEEIAAFRTGFPSSLKHDYAFKDRKQFGVEAIAHSKDSTYIWANPQEVPTLYELKDGKPSLINFEFAGGVYVIPKVLDAGYLAVGKRKLQFKREE